mgnify:CR=1 FL=1
MQLMLDKSYEFGEIEGLGIIEGEVISIKSQMQAGDVFKIPHIGWNDIQINHKHPVLENIKDGDQFYFVHSYYAKLVHEAEVVSSTTYGNMNFCSILAKENLFATQFHLEKSGELGLKILRSFGDWNP